MLADGGAVAVSAEIARERLFADDMLAGLHRLDDHGGVQIGWRADVDNFQFAVGDQIAKAAVGPRYPVPTGKIDNMVAARRDGFDFDIDAVDTPVSIHVQFRDETAPGQTDPDFRQ